MDVANTSGALGADGVFDEGDLSALLNQLTVNPVPLDYGRFDLNGDGYTGGGTTRMDLDGVRPVAWGFSQRHDILGVKVLRDENVVRDLDVLCHEVTGPHYTGDVMARDNFAKNHCLPTVGLFTDPAFPVGGTARPRHAAANRGPGHGHGPRRRQLPGVRLEISAVGGDGGRRHGRHRAGWVVHHHGDTRESRAADRHPGHRPRRRGRPRAGPDREEGLHERSWAPAL